MSGTGTSGPDTSTREGGLGAFGGYLLLGLFFGIVLSKSEAISWWRIQEMFRFQSFHMYGLMGSAWLVATLSLQWIKRQRRRSMLGREIEVEPKEPTPGYIRYWAGGTVFGLGWALLGACPGPLFVLIGQGLVVYGIALLAAVFGTALYALLRDRLPH